MPGNFLERWDQAFPEILKIWNELYPGANVNIDDLKAALSESSDARPQYLKERDKELGKDAEWYLSAKWVGMMFYVDRFAGKIPDFHAKIPYLEELGVNLFHLMPLLKRRQGENDGGYAVSDYGTVDPEFGTNSELVKLIEEAHSRDKLIMMDMVLNHTADDHEWALKAKNGDKEYLDYYIHFDSREEVDEYDPYMPEIFPATAPGSFTYNEETGKWMTTVFYSYQWDLNYRNPRVFIEIVKAMLNLANMGVDVIRLDAIIFIWKEKGTECQNQPEVHSILRLLKLCTSCVAPHLLLVAEAIATQDKVVPYFGRPGHRESDLAYNTSLMSCLWDALNRGKTDTLNAVYKKMPGKPDGATWLNYIRCHDDISMAFTDVDLSELGYNPTEYRLSLESKMIGKTKDSFSRGLQFMPNEDDPNRRVAGSLASLAGLEQALESGSGDLIEKALKRIELLNAVLLSAPGVPMLYYGDEIATLNDYGFLDDPKRREDTRWVNRPVSDWERAELRKEDHTPESRVFRTIRELIKIRKQNELFRDQNEFELIETGDQVFSFTRGKNERIYCVFNFSDSVVRIPGMSGESIINKFKYNTSEDHLMLNAYGYDWILMNT